MLSTLALVVGSMLAKRAGKQPDMYQRLVTEAHGFKQAKAASPKAASEVGALIRYVKSWLHRMLLDIFLCPT